MSTTVYIDGACKSNGFEDAIASVGIFFAELDIKHSEKLEADEPQTNGRAELKALIVAMELLIKQGVDKATIKSDSKYVVNAAEKYVFKWKERNWMLMSENTQAKHKDLWEQYLLLRSKISIELVHVKRDAEEGNTIADRLANEAIQSAMPAKRIPKKSTRKHEGEASKNKIVSNNCILCNQEAKEAIQCSVCQGWVHYACSKLPCYQITILGKSNRTYTCEKCVETDEDLIEILESSQSVEEQVNCDSQAAKSNETDTINNLNRQVELCKEELKDASDKSQRFECRVKQLQKTVEDLLKTKSELEESNENINKHQEVLRDRMKVAERETQRYKDLADDRNTLIKSLTESKEKDTATISNLEKELKEVKELLAKNQQETTGKDQERQGGSEIQNIDSYKKQIKGKDKEIKNLKEEVVRYKEKLEISLSDLNTAKNEKRQLCNYLDDVKKLNQDLITQIESFDNNKCQKKSHVEKQENNPLGQFSVNSIPLEENVSSPGTKPPQRSWEPVTRETVNIETDPEDDNINSNLPSDTEDEVEETSEKVENTRLKKLRFAPNPYKIVTPRKVKPKQQDIPDNKSDTEHYHNKSKRERDICWSYRLGISCRFGDNCRFRHNVVKGTKDEICNHHLRGRRCRFQENCFYYHVTEQDKRKMNGEQYNRHNHDNSSKSSARRYHDNQWGRKEYEPEIGFGYNEKYDDMRQPESANNNISQRMSFLEKSILDLTKQISTWQRMTPETTNQNCTNYNQGAQANYNQMNYV